MSYTSNDLSVLAYANTSFGSANGDASVLAIIFTDEDGHYYLHHLSYIRTSGTSDDDEATQQCKQIVALCQRFYVPSVSVEINGIGKFLPAILKREMRAASHHCAVVERASRIPKSQRILEGFDAVLAARALSVHGSVKQTPFLTEMREWRPTSTNAKDDGLDAVAGALSQEPIRIGSGNGGVKARHNWQGSSSIFRIKN